MNPILSMSSDIIDGEKAIELARNFLMKAGYSYANIDNLRKEGGNWIIHAETLLKDVDMKINESGKLLEIRPAKR